MLISSVEHKTDEQQTQVQPQSQYSRQMKIIINDNEEAFRQMLRMCLTSAGHIVIEANGMEQTIAQLHANPECNVLLTDKDGSGGVRLVEETIQAFPKLPIVMMSGGFTPVSNPAEFGIDPKVVLLPKPFEVRKLIELLEFAIEHAA